MNEEDERRVAALEEKVDRLTSRVHLTEGDAAAARILAGAADRDVAEFKAEMRQFRQHNTELINALSDQVNGRIDGLETEMRAGFTEMRGKFDQLAGGLEQITQLLTERDGSPDNPDQR